MREPRALVGEYMAFRDSRGFQPNRKLARMLGQFVDSLPAGRADGLLFSQGDALAWANAPLGASPVWVCDRLSMVRGFAAYAAGAGLPVGVPGPRLTPGGFRRATPYLYSAHDIWALMSACDHLFGPLRAATMKTLIGLLAVTGMRIGEAVRLVVGDVDWGRGVVTIAHAKFGRQRVVVLDPSSCAALAAYLAAPARRRLGAGPGQTVFVTAKSTALATRTADGAFRQLADRAGLPVRAGARPRLHDFRHTFATTTMIDAYRCGRDPARTLTLLSAWLGHANPADTYWYLQAAPEIAAVAAARLEPGEES